MGSVGAPLAAGLWLAFACAPAERTRSADRASAAFAASELPGPTPRGRSADEAAALNRTCEGCHPDIAAEWRASLHARAHTDAVYQRAFAIEPLPFCQGCHAPEADPDQPVPANAAELGVACVTCHVLAGEIAAARPRADDARHGAAAAAPHPVLRDERLEGSAACAGCHEFAFPDRAARSRAELMQSTVSEHARSSQRDRACADCHMPRNDAGRRSHVFPGGRDENLVKGAVAVSARRTPNGSVHIALRPLETGHAFPTGDLFRRLELSAEAVGGEWQVVATQRRYLTRHWQRQPSPFGVLLRTATSDDRPLASEVEIELPLGSAARGLPAHWRVAYQRVEHPRSDREEDSSVEGEIEIGSGTLEGKP
jgi:hypothetical protein